MIRKFLRDIKYKKDRERARAVLNGILQLLRDLEESEMQAVIDLLNENWAREFVISTSKEKMEIIKEVENIIK